MLRDGKELSKSLLDEVNILLVVLDSTSDNNRLFGSNIVHKELLEHASIDIVEVVLETEAGHAEGVVTIGSTEEEILVLREWIILVKVMGKIVGLLVLGAGNVGSEN